MPQERINYAAILAQHPWLFERDLDCIVSPDSDGLLCGLFMAHTFGWNIKGFYDGKVLAVAKGTNPRSCVFLDMEIGRTGVRSIGQHMLMYDKKAQPVEWSAFADAISPNNLHAYDFKSNFKQKYPLGTIHALLALVAQKIPVTISKDAVSPLLYTDGTFKNQFNYPENCIEWLEFLDAPKGGPLKTIFMDPHYTTFALMNALKDLFKEFEAIGGGKRGGDKIRISDSKGGVVNIDAAHSLVAPVRSQAEALLTMLGTKTGWTYESARWSWGPYDVRRFQKGSVVPSKRNYLALLAQKPLSLAIISRQSIEYTLDPNGLF